MNIIKKWIIAIRAPFFTGIIVPIFFGTALAYYETGNFSGVIFIVTLFGGIFAHAGANLANDYYDHKTTDDDINQNFTPFSGGSRIIQNGFLTARSVISGAFICWGLALAAGIYLTIAISSYWILVLAVAGFLGGFFYTATRKALSYNTLGEVAILLNFGVLPIMGSYFVQTGYFSWASFITSFPIGFLITAILYINQYPDYDADKAVNKNHLVVTLGRKKAMIGYYFLIFGSYLGIVLAVALSYLTPFALIALLTLPLAVKTVRIFNKEYEKIKELIPAMAGTIQIHLLTGLLMSVGCVTGAILR
jgi:1,4-dihydroxy-2-naphthoate octaprenyltransferase